MAKKQTNTTPIDSLHQAEVELIALQCDIKEGEEKMKIKQASTGKMSILMQTLCAIQTRRDKEHELMAKIQCLCTERVAKILERGSSPLSEVSETNGARKAENEPNNEPRISNLGSTKELNRSNRTSSANDNSGETVQANNKEVQQDNTDASNQATEASSQMPVETMEANNKEVPQYNTDVSNQMPVKNDPPSSSTMNMRAACASMLSTEQLIMQVEMSLDEMMYGSIGSRGSVTSQQKGMEKMTVSQGALEWGVVQKYLARNKYVTPLISGVNNVNPASRHPDNKDLTASGGTGSPSSNVKVSDVTSAASTLTTAPLDHSANNEGSIALTGTTFISSTTYD
ncbi:hypothetical protein GYMLUDRAFT_251711 [Collybiopsis luxurians FD-317 M1]|uniref:Uncharacterized protein n=1 Tax=Collybiopsis luxurians FD-317 M1 TaxID=944289 RepID=A0A0D0C210_9AGAR|nr:hypothetical protein GYMLUDRAFT_251711 [Collybiopsis luxurians FD-317 M1]